VARFGGCDVVTCCNHRACLAPFVRFALVGLVFAHSSSYSRCVCLSSLCSQLRPSTASRRCHRSKAFPPASRRVPVAGIIRLNLDRWALVPISCKMSCGQYLPELASQSAWLHCFVAVSSLLASAQDAVMAASLPCSMLFLRSSTCLC